MVHFVALRMIVYDMDDYFDGCTWSCGVEIPLEPIDFWDALLSKPSLLAFMFPRENCLASEILCRLIHLDAVTRDG